MEGQITFYSIAWILGVLAAFWGAYRGFITWKTKVEDRAGEKAEDQANLQMVISKLSNLERHDEKQDVENKEFRLLVYENLAQLREQHIEGSATMKAQHEETCRRLDKIESSTVANGK